MNLNYINNHNHTDEGSNLRMLDCTNKIEALIDRAVELGYKGISITDHSSISSHIRAIQHTKKLKEKDIDFILGLGSEEYVVNSLEEVRDNYISGVTKFPHFIFIAKDSIGYEQIRRIDSQAWENSYMTGKMRRTPIEKQQIVDIIGNNKGHLKVSTGCLGGEMAILCLEYLKTKNVEIQSKIEEFVDWMISTFSKENIAFEIQPSNQIEQIEYNKFLIQLGEFYDIPIIITTDSHYLKKEDRPIHEAFIKSRDAEDREVGEFYATTYLMTIEELWDYTKEYLSEEQFKSIIENSYNFTKDVDFIDMEHTTIIPARDLSQVNFEIKHIFKDYYGKYEGINKFAHSDNIQDKYLFYMIEDGFVNKKQEFNEANLSKLDWELNEIWAVSEALNDKMSAYYNLVDYIVDICWTIGFVGVSRGSVTGYYSMYLIDMHQMNPVEWNMPSYRHLNSSRVSFPDVDLDTSARNRPKIIAKLKEVFGEDNILNICAFRTETNKSACKTACRGLGIPNEEADYLSSLVPVERGKQWSVSDCLYGNEEKDRKPCIDYINQINKLSSEYNVDLLYALKGIEGLVSGLTIHASGVYIFKDGYIKQNSKMKTPRGDEVTAWEMADSDYCGGLKYDSLTTECQDKLEVCTELLLKYNKIDWQGDIRTTYNKYLHPDVLDYTNKEMWDECSNGQIIDLFQFITPVGGQCVKKIKPHSLIELSNANSLMRISVKDAEQPIDKFIRYKNNIQLWYDELKEYGITRENEIKALEEILLPNYGVANTQEDIMELSMHKDISAFTLADADKMRKIVAKKKDNEVSSLKEKFYNYVKENGNSINIANYVWEQCIKPQLAYSFSRNHVNPYSCEALQEMNLYHFNPTCYWNCAVLTVNAGLSNEENSKNTDYGKIAKAIYRSKSFNVDVLPPDINKADISFTPNEEKNTILFGLGGISGINTEIAKQIIDNRPYTDFDDFYKKNKFDGSLVTKSKFVTLIKAGCFDETDNKITAMKWLSVYENPKKESLTTANIPNAIAMGMEFPNDLITAYNFKKYVLSKQFFYCNDPKAKSKKHYLVESEYALPYFEEHCIDALEEEKDYYYTNEGLVVIDKSLDKALKPKLELLKAYIGTQEFLDKYNTLMWQNAYLDLSGGSEDINNWSFDAISFYPNGDHELANIDNEYYNISDFNELSEEPNFIEKNYGKRSWKQYDICRICGTVLDKKDKDSYITILTPTNEVVNVKFNKGQYAYYKQVITDGDLKDESYFKRGTLLMISGYRKGEDTFVAKKYKNTPFQHTCIKVLKVNKDKSLELQLERLGNDDEL